MTPEMKCPHCGASNDATTGLNGPGGATRPHAGDFSLCIYCGEWAVFGAERMRAPTDDEQIEIGLNKRCRAAREAWVKMPRLRRK